MKYQIHGLTKDAEYNACIAELKRLGVPTHQWPERNARFDTRPEAERILAALQTALPGVPLGIEEVNE
jgi:hypothetical protein